MIKGQKYEWFSHSGKTRFTGVFEEIADFGHDYKEDLRARFTSIKSFPKNKDNVGKYLL